MLSRLSCSCCRAGRVRHGGGGSMGPAAGARRAPAWRYPNPHPPKPPSPPLPARPPRSFGRENNTGRFPRGLSLMLRSMAAWIYDRDPFRPMKWQEDLEAFKARLAAGEDVFGERWWGEEGPRVGSHGVLACGVGGLGGWADGRGARAWGCQGDAAAGSAPRPARPTLCHPWHPY